MLKKIRRILATLFFTAITLMFLDFTGTLHRWLGWMAKVQFLPAVLAINVVVIAALVVLTLIFGRIYCSVVCPLGVMQDFVAWLHNRHRRGRYNYSPSLSWLRYTMLAVMVVAIAAGIGSLMALLAPYSTYGRIATHLLQPLWMLANNLLATLAERVDSYAFYSVDVWMRTFPTFLIAAATLVIIGTLAWRNGRTYCNTICPVGTVLGFLARWSLLKVRFVEDKCRNCSKCTKNCKAACIDYKNHQVDYSRCVVCGECVSQCAFGALKYGIARNTQPEKTKTEEQGGLSRRSFLLTTALAATAVMADEKKTKVDGGLATIEKKTIPERQTPIMPPGALSAANMARRCTGCQLCVSECPNSVLRPSTGLATLMQPVMSYERGYCRPECHRCAEVCPAGAIQPITLEEKASTQIGHAVWVKKNCLPLTDGVECGNCARHCPAGAIEMVPFNEDDDESPMIPAVNESRCIGCGACEHLCPARPFSAIIVEGHEVHRKI